MNTFTIFDHKNANLFPSPQRNNTLYIRLACATWKFVRAVFRWTREKTRYLKKNFTPWYNTPHRYHKAGNSKWHVWVENSVNKNKNRNSKSIRKILWSHHFHTSVFVGEKKSGIKRQRENFHNYHIRQPHQMLILLYTGFQKKMHWSFEFTSISIQTVM